MSMRLFIGGMRGSQPATGAAFEEFGGDTTSLLVLGSQGERLVLDAGTGMHRVAKELAAMGSGNATILFSHYHLDHMIGLMMNPLFYKPDWSFKFVGPTLANADICKAVTQILAPPYWPIPWERMDASFEFVEFAMDETHIGGLRVRGCPVPHPGGCLAYRIDDTESCKSLVFATDIEWRNRTNVQEAAFKTLCREPRPADLLIMDAHFAEADAEAFAGWGHTCWQDGLEIAASTGIKHVLLGHHAPGANDKTLHALEQQAKKCRPGAAMARAGRWLTVDS